MTTTFIESGTAATQDTKFYSAMTGTVASATDQAHTGTRSLKLSTGSPAASATASAPTGVLADAGRRWSFWWLSDTAPAAVTDVVIALTSGGTFVFSIRFNTNRTLQIRPNGPSVVNASTAVSLNAWHRISVGYTITNTTTWRIDLYLDGVFQASATSGTLTTTGTSIFRFSLTSAAGANVNSWYSDVYVDDGSDYSDPGDIRVTAKRPNANGTTNNFVTQIGSGGSGYGTGHSPQVNERPLSITNGWSVVAVAATTEEYNIESRVTGDVDITRAVIADYAGWVYAKTLNAETGSVIVNGVSSNISLTTTTTLFTAFAGSTTYPAGTGTDIGMVTTNLATTVSLYECGMLIAYLLPSRLAATGVGP